MKIELSLKGFSIELKNSLPRLVVTCPNNRGGKTRRVSSVGLRSEEGHRNGRKLSRAPGTRAGGRDKCLKNEKCGGGKASGGGGGVGAEVTTVHAETGPREEGA